MNGALATAAYDLAGCLRVIDAVLLIPGLTWVARKADRVGDALDAAQVRTDQTKRYYR